MPFVRRFTQVCLFCRSPGLDRRSDTDLFFSGCGVWCANCLFQLQQIQQQLLQVKRHTRRGKRGFRETERGQGITHKHTRNISRWITITFEAPWNPRCLWHHAVQQAAVTPIKTVALFENHQHPTGGFYLLYCVYLFCLLYVSDNWHMTLPTFRIPPWT